MVSGLVTYRLYPSSPEAPTGSARKTDASGLYYDHFNSAVGSIQEITSKYIINQNWYRVLKCNFQKVRAGY